MERPRHTFGKSIEYRVVFQAGGQEVDAYSIVNARLYPSKPTAVQVADSAAALGGYVETPVTTWLSEGVGEYSLTFTGLDDPNQTSTNEYEEYWVVVNYRLQSGEQVQNSVEAIRVYRTGSLTSKIRVFPIDLYEFERALEKQLPNEGVVATHIRNGKRKVIRKLKAKGFKPELVTRYEELNEAAVFYALESACRDLAKENSQLWLTKAASYEAEGDAAFDAADIGYDSDNDGSEDTSVTNGIVFTFI